MARTFAAAMRRAARLMRPGRLKMATRSIQKAMTGVMVKAALAPLAVTTTKTVKRRKAATAKPKIGAVQGAKPRSARKLGAVLAQLRAAKSLSPVPGPMAPSAKRQKTPATPKGAQYLSRTHRSAAGSRSYKLYLPASQPKRPKGLILMLHGCGQTPDDFALGTNMNAVAEKHGLAVAYPAQTGVHNTASCWNWFKPGNQMRGAGEPAILASLTRKIIKEFGLGRECVFVAGLSAGGAMAAILADVYPDIYSAAGVHSGLARGSARDMLSAMAAMRSGGSTTQLREVNSSARPVRRIVFQGEADSTVHPSNASMIVAAAVGSDAMPTKISKRTKRGRSYARSHYAGSDGTVHVELWKIAGASHTWSGGKTAGSYTDTKGPDASVELVRFFLAKCA